MPIINDSPSSYLPTVDEFIAHWILVNAAGAPIVLQGTYALTNLQADRTALFNAINAIEAPNNTRAQAAADLSLKRAAHVPRVSAFNRAVRDRFVGTIYNTGLPKAVVPTAGEGVLMRALQDIKDIWTKLNALPIPPAPGSVPGFIPPLTLPGTTAYTLALLNADITALDAAFIAVPNAARAATYAREQRNALFPNLRTRLQQYRKAVLGRFPADSPLVASLPAYSPEPGSTPEPFSAGGLWNSVLAKAVISYDLSATPAVTQYQLRYSPSATYKSSDEEVVATNALAVTPRQFLTTRGLIVAGNAANYKVYALTPAGNERGSNAVRVVRG